MPTHVDGYHCLPATGLIPRLVQSRMIDRTDSPCSSSRTAASRIASASGWLMSSLKMERLCGSDSAGLA